MTVDEFWNRARLVWGVNRVVEIQTDADGAEVLTYPNSMDLSGFGAVNHRLAPDGTPTCHPRCTEFAKVLTP